MSYEFVKFHQELLYEIYNRCWLDWFKRKEVWDLILEHGEDRGFLTRAVNRGIFDYERGKLSHLPGKYRMQKKVRDELLKIIGKRI